MGTHDKGSIGWLQVSGADAKVTTYSLVALALTLLGVLVLYLASPANMQ
jgi:hypothetical protein